MSFRFAFVTLSLIFLYTAKFLTDQYIQKNFLSNDDELTFILQLTTMALALAIAALITLLISKAIQRKLDETTNKINK